MGGAGRRDDVVQPSGKRIVDPAGARRDEPVGVAHRAAARREQPPYQAPLARLLEELRFRAVFQRPHDCPDFARCRRAEPVAMQESRVRQVEEILQAGLHGSAKKRLHGEAGPARLAQVGKCRRCDRRLGVFHRRPDESVLFGCRIALHRVRRLRRLGLGQRRHLHDFAPPAVAPAVIGAFEASARDLAHRERSIAVRAPVLQRHSGPACVAKQHYRMPLRHDAERSSGLQLARATRDEPWVQRAAGRGHVGLILDRICLRAPLPWRFSGREARADQHHRALDQQGETRHRQAPEAALGPLRTQAAR